LPQNVDGLERKTGIPDDKIVEAHGSFYKSHCLGCNAEYSFEWMKGQNLYIHTFTKCAIFYIPLVLNA
jgi:NAD-dependent deacetylase sirtuin 2